MSVFPGKFQIFVKLGGGGCLYPPPPGPCAFGLDSVACTMQSLFFFWLVFTWGPLSCEMGYSTDDGAN